MTELVFPSDRWRDAFLAAEEEFVSGTSPSPVHRGPDEPIEQYLDRLAAWRSGEQLPEGWVAVSVLWLVDRGDWIGRVAFRHHLTESLRTWGGHIGYEIRLTKRRRGYGTQALRLALEHAASFGIDRALVTCFADNVGSRRVIEANGGRLEAEFVHEGRPALRYWVNAPASTEASPPFVADPQTP